MAPETITLATLKMQLDETLLQLKNQGKSLENIEQTLLIQSQEMKALQNTVSVLQKDNEYMARELLKVNLVVSGIEDDPDESEDDLFVKVANQFNEVSDLSLIHI